MAFPEFQTKEVLNKVLNSGKDALNVDLSDSVTVTVDSEFPAAAALADDSGNPTTTSVGSHLLGYDSGNTNWNRVEVDDAGHLQIDVLSITAGDNNIGNVDIASIAAGDNNIGNVDIASALPAGSNTIGVVDLGSTDNAVLDAMVVDLAAMEVLLTAANVDHAANEALLTTIDSDTNDIKTDIAALEVLSTAANVDLAEIEVATEASQAALEKMLYGTALAVTAVHGGSDHSLGATYEAFFIGVGGDISLDCATSGSNIVFKNVASGQLLPVRATVVNQTGTTATDIVALKA
jgi:hypothetical protein